MTNILQNHPKGAPGSPTAINNGCKCPVIDNGHGRGMYTDTDGIAVYAVNRDCPIHHNEIDCFPIPFEEM